MILSDGDMVFQPRKMEQSGLAEAADDNVLIYVHKEDWSWRTWKGAIRRTTTCWWTTSCVS